MSGFEDIREDMTLVRRATADDAGRIAPLFDSYRQFYGHPADPELARRFIGDRLSEGSSILFVAEADGEAVGFVQLYPSFSSMTGRLLSIA